MINISNLIITATKEKSKTLGTYKLIKAEFLRWVKDNPDKNFNEAVEAKILKKMHTQRMESAELYEKAGRNSLAENEKFEAGIIEQFLPKEPSEEEITKETTSIIENEFKGNVTMKDMKRILSLVQIKYPGASGKIISNIVKSYGSK
jgi:uncharacterized protein YqeY